MNLLKNQKTTILPDAEIKRRWILMDAENQVLGRVAGRIVHHLRGKHRPDYSPHQECGDYIVVINAAKVKTTGQKAEQKVYYKHSGFTGGMKQALLGRKLKEDPTFPLQAAVKRMLPSGRLGRKLLGNVHIYAEGTHPHQSQQPVPVEIKA